MKNYLISLIAFFSAFSYANEHESWVLIGENTDYQMYISPESIRDVQENAYSPVYQQAWFRFDAQRDLPHEKLKRGDYRLNYIQFDCALNTLAQVKRMDYANDGRLLTEYASPTLQMRAIQTHSVGEHLANVICLFEKPQLDIEN